MGGWLGFVSLVLITMVSLKTVNLVTTMVLCTTSGGFTICRSPQVTGIDRILPRTGYNKYNCPNYSNFTNTYIGTTSTNSLRNGLYPINNTPMVRGMTTVLKLRTITTRPGITIMEYGNDYRGHPHATLCSKTGSYTVTRTASNNRANYAFNYLNYNSYIRTYRFSTVRVGPRANLPRISRRGYATYKTYDGTYPHGVVRVHPGKGGGHHMIIVYIGGSGKTITGGTYGTDYVNYKGYIGIYPFRTVALRGRLTCVSPTGYGSYHGYRSRYPGKTVRTVGFPPHGPGMRIPTNRTTTGPTMGMRTSGIRAPGTRTIGTRTPGARTWSGFGMDGGLGECGDRSV